MGRVGVVTAVEDDGAVRCDLGGEDSATADPFAPAGDDAPPLTGDDVALSEAPGAGGYQVTGFGDATDKKAAGGEKRIYARDPDGAPVAEVWCKGDGSISIEQLTSGASVLIDPEGNVRLGSASASVEVALASLVHQAIADMLTVGSLFAPPVTPGPATFAAVKTAWEAATGTVGSAAGLVPVPPATSITVGAAKVFAE